MMDDAVKWVTEPWRQTPLVVIDDLFGKDAVANNSRAYGSWAAIVEYFPKMLAWTREAYAAMQKTPSPPSRPPPPSTAPKAVPKNVYKRTNIDDDSWGTTDESQDSWGATVADTRRPSKKIRGADGVELQDWQSLDFSVEKWVATLRNFGVDDLAQKSLFLLAQLGDEGAKKANSVVAKLLKKAADGEQINNASAMVHSCCKSARHQIMPLEVEHRKNYASWGERNTWGTGIDNASKSTSSTASGSTWKQW
jgi:hypothetical protein